MNSKKADIINNVIDNKNTEFYKINYELTDQLSDSQRKKNKERALKRASDYIHNECEWGWRLWD